MLKKSNTFEWVTWVLVLVGAVNWALVGAFKFDLIQVILGTSPTVANLFSVVVGLSGFYWVFRTLRDR